ncbi:MAG: glycosyltransferase family 2 protein [Geminicoccaceae bacterium]
MSSGHTPLCSSAEPSVGVVVVTWRAREHLCHCLPPLLASPLRPRVLVVNSSSNDGTVERAAEMGADTLVVPRAEFNHGLTRELARRHLGTDIVVMLTPDAYATDVGFVGRLTAPIRSGEAVVAYGRQVARPGAGLFERFPRDFNYPAKSQLRSLADWDRYGSYTHFCSNACAAWKNEALDAIGGFPTTLVSEETIAVAQLLERGGRIAYVADAVVVHSHAYGLVDEFRRHFDIGYTRRRFGHLLRARERDEVRGRRYASDLLRLVRRKRPLLLLQAVGHLGAKYLGFRVGLLGPRLPVWLARRLSGQDFYWSSTVVAGRPGLALAGT